MSASDCPNPEIHSVNGGPMRYCPCGWAEASLGASPLTLRGTLSNGLDFAASLTKRTIVLRVGEQTCVAHPNWMTADEAKALIAQLAGVVAGEGDPE